MLLYSTENPDLRVDFAKAIFQAMPRDGGLYMPVDLSPLSKPFWDKVSALTLGDIGVEITNMADGIAHG